MGENKVSKALLVCGVIVMIMGFILGIVGGLSTEQVITDDIYDDFDDGVVYYDESFSSFQFLPFLMITIGGFIVGMLFIGLAEIVSLLDKIHNRISPTSSVKGKEQTKKLGQFIWQLSENDKEKVEKLFPMQINDIIVTPFDSLCVVILQSEVASVIKIVDLGGFSAEEVQDKEVVEEVMDWYQKHMK